MEDFDRSKAQIMEELSDLRRMIDDMAADETPETILNGRLQREIEERKQAQETLEKKTRLNQILLDSMPCIALLMRPQTREIVASNAAAAKVGAIPGERCFATWGQREKACSFCRAPKVWARGEPQHLEVEYGGAVWDAHWMPISDDLYLHYAFDITERKAAERERERLLKELTARNKELQDIVFAASHDLKSPLVNIKGFAGELGRYCKDLQDLLMDQDITGDAKERIAVLLEDYIPESVRFIDAGSKKMTALLDGLLRVSRVGSEDIVIAPLDMNRVIESVIAAIHFQIDNVRATVTADDLPKCLGDSEQISRVFANLLDNALKYLDRERKGVIHISAAVEDGECIYCVQDNGIGIASGHQEKVFEIFHRLHPTDPAGGEGLGLTIVSRILERHDGRIRVESKAGKGSRFFVALPST